MNIRTRSSDIGKFALAAEHATGTAAAGYAEPLSVTFWGRMALPLVEQKPTACGIIFSELRLLLLLLIASSTIILAYLMSYKYLSNLFFFDLDKEFTIPSLYQYALLGGSALCLYRAQKNQALYRPWAYLFMFLFVDDVISIHESVGKFLGHAFVHHNILFFTRRSFGEFVFLSAIGLLFVHKILCCYIRASRLDKRFFETLLVLAGALVIFGEFFDIAHDYLRKIDENLTFWAGLFEDGGEIFTASLIFWVCNNLYRYYCSEALHVMS